MKESQGLSPSGTGENWQSQLLRMGRAHKSGRHTWWPGALVGGHDSGQVHWWSVAGVRYSHVQLTWPKLCSGWL